MKAETLLATATALAGVRIDAGRDTRLAEAYRAVEKGYASRRQEKLVEADLLRLDASQEIYTGEEARALEAQQARETGRCPECGDCRDGHDEGCSVGL